MCNLYSITTNQAAIIALFRVVNRYVGNLAPMPGVFPEYPAPVIRNTDTGTELAMMRWAMPPPPRTGGPPVTNILNVIAALAGLAEAGEPMPSSFQQLRGIRAGAEPGNEEERCCLVRAQRRQTPHRLRRHLDDVQRRSRHQIQAGARTAPSVRISDDLAERRRRAHPPKSNAGHSDNR
jgi:hypothetical protein